MEVRPLAFPTQSTSHCLGAWGVCRTRQGCLSPDLQEAERWVQGQGKAEAVGMCGGGGFPGLTSPGSKEPSRPEYRRLLEKSQLGCSPGGSPKVPLQRQPML